jgi:peptidoglycan-associated lipoprotein
MTRKVLSLCLLTIFMLGLTACPKKVLPPPEPPKKIEEPVAKPEPVVEPVVEESTETVETPELPMVEESTETVVEPSIRDKEFEPIPELAPVYFDFDNSDVSADNQKIIERNAEYVKKSTGSELLLEGYTCECGTNEYNLALAQKRAQSVRDYYIKLGIDPMRIATISYGKEQPVNLHAGPPDTPGCSLNRRVNSKIHNKK